MFRTLALALVAVGCLALSPRASAQYVPHAVYYAPAPVAAPVAVAAPVVAAPQPTVVYRPVLRPNTRYVVPAPTPVVVARPMVAAPVAPATVVAPTPVTVTRRRPILGGTVTRTYYRYAPIPAVPVY